MLGVVDASIKNRCFLLYKKDIINIVLLPVYRSGNALKINRNVRCFNYAFA